mmetsp:Transcript_19828/g.22964  ORF Transcript_19828/g.22964 Transcript_19828/m.22964 type:complete len:229 (+) Transcript_19828:114-800(+)
MDMFWKILNDKMYTAAIEGRHKRSWNGPNKNDYEPELARLRPHFKPIVWGVCSAISLFVSFRINRVGGFTRAADNGRFIWEWKSTKTMQHTKQQVKEGLASLPSDFLLSALMGSSISFFLSDFSKMEADIQIVPLVKGRSFISDELCTDFITKYNRIPPQQWGKSTNSDKYSSTFKSFVMNCQKRKVVEDHLKQKQNNQIYVEQGVGISIPSPGVDYQLALIKATQKK